MKSWRLKKVLYGKTTRQREKIKTDEKKKKPARTVEMPYSTTVRQIGERSGWKEDEKKTQSREQCRYFLL